MSRPRLLVCALALLAAAALGGCGDDPAARSAAANSAPAGTASATPSTEAGPTSEASATTGSTQPSPATTRPGTDHRRVFPVDGRASYSRTHSGYPATDIFAACGLPVRAVIDGTVLEVSRADRFDPANPKGADKGGLSVSLLGADGVRYYGSHLTVIAAGIDVGVRVTAGQQLGTVGRTGDASNVCHLHFGISPPCQRTGDWWVRRGVVYPWRYLDGWRSGQSLSPVSEVANWQRTRGCPATPPPGQR